MISGTSNDLISVNTDLITDLILHNYGLDIPNYGLDIAQLRTLYCTITDFIFLITDLILRNYGLHIATLRITLIWFLLLSYQFYNRYHRSIFSLFAGFNIFYYGLYIADNKNTTDFIIDKSVIKCYNILKVRITQCISNISTQLNIEKCMI